MPFGIAGLITHLRDSSNKSLDSKDTVQKGIKRSCPSPTSTPDRSQDTILPAVADVLDDILKLLTNTNIDDNRDSAEIVGKDDYLDSKEISSKVDGDHHTTYVSDENINDGNDVQIGDFSYDHEIEAKADIFDFENTPFQVTGCWTEFKNKKGDNYTRGCKWYDFFYCLQAIFITSGVCPDFL